MTALLVVAMSLCGQIEPLQEPLEPAEPSELLPLEPAQPAPAPAQPAEPAQPAAPQGPAPKYTVGTVLYVDASSLALRSGPKRDAMLVHYMPRNTRVEVASDVIDPVPDKIGSKEGYWVYVRDGNHKGYAFDAYLVAAPPTLEETLDWTCVPGKRVGPITAKTTYDDLVATFGEPNVGDANIPIGDGKVEPGTVIFPDSPDKRLFIQWEIPKKKPHAVIIEGARWKTTKGIGIGTPLSHIIEVNNAPISFAGFGWDYAGYVMSWRGGSLEEDHVLGEDLSLFLAPKQPYIPSDFEALQGDREFSSDTPEAGKLNLYVKAMTVYVRD